MRGLSTTHAVSAFGMAWEGPAENAMLAGANAAFVSNSRLIRFGRGCMRTALAESAGDRARQVRG